MSSCRVTNDPPVIWAGAIPFPRPKLRRTVLPDLRGPQATARDFAEAFMNRFNGVSVAAFLSAAMPLASASAIMAADGLQPPKSAVPDGASTSSAGKPMIIQNPSGTFTVQKEPLEGAKVFDRLVIPPRSSSR